MCLRGPPGLCALGTEDSEERQRTRRENTKERPDRGEERENKEGRKGRYRESSLAPRKYKTEREINIDR